ncbi:MAG: hypothetical protein O2968_06545 [Acidobacteria bacterium]|nr:hypothetical protein [Acidobacteriota bacterium]
MKTRTVWTLVIGSLLVAVAALTQAPQGGAGELARYVPEGSLLVLEAENFAALLRDWNTAPQKTVWLASDNYSSFSRSKLFLRLQEAQSEFATAAGLPADMPLVESVAGRESIVAVYDVGSLQFLYITRLPSAQAMESALWRTRANFEPRNAGQRPYYVRADAASQREVAFATSGDYLLLATSGDVLAAALRLLVGEPQAAVTSEAWYADAAAARSQRGELRMLMNLERLVRTPHFRSYWIQQNVSEVGKYRTGVADLFRSGTEFKEERTFLPAVQAVAGQQSQANAQAAANLLRFAPNGAGFHAVRPLTSTAEAVNFVADKLLTPRISGMQRVQNAPQVYVGDGRTGDEGALETRIDQPPAVYSSGGLAQEAVVEAFESNPPLAALQVESSRKSGGDVFVGTDTALVLVAASDWDAAALRPAFQSAVRGLWTTSSLGAQWTQQSIGGETFHQFGGLTPLVIAVRGPHLFLANSAELLISVLARATSAAGESPVLYAAQFRRAAEQANYETLMRHLDYLQFGQYRFQQNREPDFFSENVASLGRTLERVESMSIRVARNGESVNQTVIYRLSE